MQVKHLAQDVAGALPDHVQQRVAGASRRLAPLSIAAERLAASSPWAWVEDRSGGLVLRAYPAARTTRAHSYPRSSPGHRGRRRSHTSLAQHTAVEFEKKITRTASGGLRLPGGRYSKSSMYAVIARSPPGEAGDPVTPRTSSRHVERQQFAQATGCRRTATCTSINHQVALREAHRGCALPWPKS